VVVTSYDRGIYVWNTSTGQLQATIIQAPPVDKDYHLLGFSPDGKLTAVYLEYAKRLFDTVSTIELRDTWTGEIKVTLKGRNMMYATHQVVWSADSKTLAIAGGNKGYEGKIWDVTTGKLNSAFKLLAKLDDSFWAPGYKDLDRMKFHPHLPILMITNNNYVRFVNPADGELLQRLDNTRAATWTKDGRRLITSTADGKSIQIWELVNGWQPTS